MTAPRRRAARLVPLSLLGIALALMAVGCSPSISPAASRTVGPSLTPVAGGPSSPPAAASVTLPSTTETEFGRIWDALPPSFPQMPGQQPADPGGGPTSGSFILNTDVATASAAFSAALTARGWSVVAGSPLEDGSVVLDLGGAREGCVAEVRFTPTSGTVVMSVLYGAECPFG